MDDQSGSTKTLTVMGLRVYNDVLDRIPIAGPPRVIATISPNSYGMATKNSAFGNALRSADYLVLDGVYFGLAAILLQGQRLRINNGPMVFRNLMQRLDRTHGRAFFLGSSTVTLQKIKTNAAIEYPNVTVGSFSPPFVKEFTEEQHAEMVAKVCGFGPDVLFVGMTAPKQELWAHRNASALPSGLVASIGAVFDWYAGNEKDIAPIWWRLHLGWLIRTIRRPEILRRYPNILIFFRDLMMTIMRLK